MPKHKGSLQTYIDRLLGSIEEPGSLSELVYTASGSSANLREVTKRAIHYRVLGDAELGLWIGKLLLELDKLENERPEIMWEQTVASTLVVTLNGPLGKVAKDVELTEKEILLYYERARAALRIIREIAEKNPLKVIGPLLVSLNGDHTLFKDEIDKLLYHLREVNLGRVELRLLRKFIMSAIYCLDDFRLKHAYYFIRKLIEEGKNDLIYIVRPLFNELGNEKTKELAEELLIRMSMQKLGTPDEETAEELRTVLSRRGKVSNLATGYLRKIKREGGINLDSMGDSTQGRIISIDYEGPRLIIRRLEIASVGTKPKTKLPYN